MNLVDGKPYHARQSKPFSVGGSWILGQNQRLPAERWISAQLDDWATNLPEENTLQDRVGNRPRGR